MYMRNIMTLFVQYAWLVVSEFSIRTLIVLVGKIGALQTHHLYQPLSLIVGLYSRPLYLEYLRGRNGW